jgi:hypothetical protein
VFACLIYLAIGQQLTRPGLQYDEAFDAVVALDTLHRAPLDPRFSLTLFGRSWPLLSLPHEGPISAYLALPALALFGASVPMLRVTHLLLGCLTLFLLWQLTRRWAGDLTAAGTVLLVATFPPFIWWTRSGGNWHDALLPSALALLLAADRFWRTRHIGVLLVTDFLAGFGITTKVLHRRVHDANVGIRERNSRVDFPCIMKSALDRRRQKAGGAPE